MRIDVAPLNGECACYVGFICGVFEVYFKSTYGGRMNYEGSYDGWEFEYKQYSIVVSGPRVCIVSQRDYYGFIIA